MNIQRATFFLCAATVEAAPAALVLTLAGGDAWPLLIGAVLAGALAGWATDRWATERQARWTSALAGGALALWAAKGAAGGGAGLLDGWGRLAAALLAFEQPGSGLPYLTLLGTLYVFWRGERLPGQDSGGISRVFWRASVALMAIIGASTLLGLLRGTGGLRATTGLLVFFGAGLLSMALGRLLDPLDGNAARLGWRGTVTLLAAIALVLGGGLLLGGAFGGQGAQVLRMAVAAVLLVATVLLAPLLILLAAVIGWIARALDFSALAQTMAQVQNTEALRRLDPGDMAALPPWLGIPLRVLIIILPLLLVLALVLLVRRRRREPSAAVEERESLWSWGALANDLRDLFAGLRRAPADEGLTGALARLRGSDPASRIRRRYIRLLLLGERRERPRRLEQTPREYEPVAAEGLGDAAPAVAGLTAAYERARYHPGAATVADAEAAERDWAAIEQAAGND